MCGFMYFVPYPQYIIHQRSPSRPDLDDLYAIASPALYHPFCHEPYSEKLSEDLRYFWRGNKVSLPPELISILLLGSVVAAVREGEALAHVSCNRDGSSGLTL